MSGAEALLDALARARRVRTETDFALGGVRDAIDARVEAGRGSGG